MLSAFVAFVRGIGPELFLHFRPPKDEIDHFDLIQLIASDQSHTPLARNTTTLVGLLRTTSCEEHGFCFASVSIPAPPFDILVRVAASGRVEKILSRPKTKMSECLVKAMQDDTFPLPPVPDYWWHLHMTIVPRPKTSRAL